MKITDVKVTPPLGPQNRNWVLMKIETDEGIHGLGEWSPNASRSQANAVRHLLIGSDPMNINALHHSRQPHLGLWQMGGIGAGVEIALWDIVGKKLGVPLCQLLGGKLRDRIRMYCDCHGGAFWTGGEFASRWDRAYTGQGMDPAYAVDAFVQMALAMEGEGFTCIKFDADFATPAKRDRYDRSMSQPEQGYIVEVMAAVRRALDPATDLALDLHGSYNLIDALSLGKKLEPLGLLWLEDPVRWEWGNVDALAKVTMQTSIPICTGELLYGAKKHRELIVKQACDILEPDFPRSGGPIELRRIAELAEMYHMSVAPHNMDSPITAIAAAHVCATIPNFLALEYHSRNIPLWSSMLDLKDPIQDGYVTAPEGPGLGIALDELKIAPHLPQGSAMWSELGDPV
jgi:L-alanine-DL-glutamate epimerase-like enolase superfamily enzyme